MLSQQVQLVLSTVSNNVPALHLMAYAFDPEAVSDCIYLASMKNTRKVSNMRANPAVSLLWDNRTGKTTDHTKGVVLTANGVASCLDNAEHKKAFDLLLKRSPELLALLSSPDAVIIAVSIDRYQWVEGYKTVLEFYPKN